MKYHVSHVAGLLCLAVLTSPIGLQVLKHNPHIDKLHLLKEPLSHQFFSIL